MTAPKLVQGYEVVIGFETHAQLSTQSKIFSRASVAFGAERGVQMCVDRAGDVGLNVLRCASVGLHQIKTAVKHRAGLAAVEHALQFCFVQCVHFGGWFFAACGCVNTEQRRTRHKHIARFNQLGEVTEEQSKQQHLNVRAIDVGIAQDANLAVTQTRQIGRVIGAMRINTNGHRNIVNFIIGKQTIAIDFPGIEYFAA